MNSLTPMLVQYLVGLCCLKWDANAIEVVVGNMVYDSSADKARDVDVTVTISNAEGVTHAFKAYEVKYENSPLDVATVEQLCIKLSDMESVTYRAVVSASGFTAAARKKAAKHGVDLLHLRSWNRPLQEQFPALTMTGTPKECFPMTKVLLCWVGQNYALAATNAKAAFQVKADDGLYNKQGKKHSRFPSFLPYTKEVALRSTEILFGIDPAQMVLRTFPVPFHVEGGAPAVGPPWPHTHTLDVGSDNVYVQTESGICRLDYVTISGYLQWQRPEDNSEYYLIENISNGEPFAGALISLGERAGAMTALVFSPKSRAIGVHIIQLEQRHLNSIRNLKLPLAKEV